MKKPIIGITSRIVDNNICKVPESIIEYVIKCGGIPMVIPNLDGELLKEIISPFDGFIIPGGVTFTKTDEYVIDYAIINDLPLIGICAGMQALGCLRYFGDDDSDQTIPTNTNINHHEVGKEYVHEININDGILKDILDKDRIQVNSRHYHMIKNDDLFVVDAISPDGVIEAIHIPNKRFIIGLQWHPEDLNDDSSKAIFAAFINTARNR